MPYRIVFMGSPEFALPSLERLAASYEVIGVVTQPDRPAGRGRELAPPPVKRLALEHSIPVIQPERLKEPSAMGQLQAWAPDVIVVAAFGQILRQPVLELPPHGCINVHASLLPRWRGAAPVQAAILNGDPESGVSIMRMDAGIDTGPVLSQRAQPILPDETGGSLAQRLGELGAGLLDEILPDYLRGLIIPQPQDETGATYAPMLKKEDGKLDFSQEASSLVRRVRAFNPWPGAFTTWEGQILKIHRARAVNEEGGEPTSTIVYFNRPAVVSGNGLLILDEVQPAGKKPMEGDVFLRGARGWGSRPVGS
jgi:methionyl-tRNA formyltransferase